MQIPEEIQLPPVAQAIVAISAIAVAITRLLTASRPFWSAFPAWVQKGIPAAAMAVAALPMAIERARTWLDVVLGVMAVIGTWYMASRGDKRPPVDKDGGPRIERVNSDPKLTREELADPPSLPGGTFLQSWHEAEGGLSLSRFAVAGVVLAIVGCSSAPPKPPCDPATLAAITARCSAFAFQCGKEGKSEAECTAACDAELEERAEACR